MNLRWLLFDYVDPRLNLSRAERRSVRQRARQLFTMRGMGQRGPGGPTVYAEVVTAIIPGIGMAIVFAGFFLLNIFKVILIPILVALQLVLTWLLFAAVCRWSWKPCVLRALREAGYDVCDRCGYWLRGLPEESVNCPECGTPYADAGADLEDGARKESRCAQEKELVSD